MPNDSAIAILNDLLEIESRSLLPHLLDSTMFTSWASAGEKRVVDRMAQEDGEHGHWIVDAIDRLGGDPLPVWADIHSAGIHYLDLAYLLPRILADRRHVLQAYEAASSQIGSHTIGSEVIARIQARLRRHIELLTTITQRVAETSAT